MIKNEFRISSLIHRQLNGSLTTDEQIELDLWINASKANQEFYEKLANAAYFQSELNHFSAIETDRIWALTITGIALDSKIAPKRKLLPYLKSWYYVAAVAAAMAFIVTGIYFKVSNTSWQDKSQFSLANDIAPGKKGATLTLANGKQIQLSNAPNGEIVNQSGVRVVKTVDGQVVYELNETTGDANQLNTLTTSKGETYFIILPDKSKVWLNAASSLTYTTNLNDHGKRKVKLAGEAYFEVFKDKQHPFIVESKEQQIEVLGTHFNVDSYSENAQTKTTLLEGLVKVSGKAGAKIIKPGQQAKLSDRGIQITEVAAEDAIAWKNGYFMFNHESLESVMQKIARWYDVQVVYENPSLKGITFLGTISRFENVSKVLNMLERTEEASFKIENRTIIISKK